MPRFKNVSPHGWDLETWDGVRRVEVLLGEEVEVTEEAALNPTYADTPVWEPVDASAKRAVKAYKASLEESAAEPAAAFIPEPIVPPVDGAPAEAVPTKAAAAATKKGDKE